MAVPREDWLRLTPEVALEPEMPIVDPHHHFWKHPGDTYFLPELIKDLESGHNIVATVFLECQDNHYPDGPPELRPVGETIFVDGLAEQNIREKMSKTAICAGIVGHVNLMLGAVVARGLEAHLAASPKRFRGIRHCAIWDLAPEMRVPEPRAPQHMMMDSKFREGFSCLSKYGLTFDSWQFFHQLPELISLVKAFPDTTFIMNHVGGLGHVGPYAGKEEEIFKIWKGHMTELAAMPNTNVKLGGLGMLRTGFRWDEQPKPPGSEEVAKGIAPYFLTCIELFGPNRCMFESNFPVDKQSYSYNVFWNAAKRITKDFSRGERAALFHDTAKRLYRLDIL